MAADDTSQPFRRDASRRQRQQPIRTLAFSVSLIALAGLHPAQAQETPPNAPAPQLSQTEAVHFDIPAGDLQTALLDFSRRVDLQLIYPAGMTAGLKTPGTQGSYTPQEALSRILAGTGIRYRFTAANTVTLERTDARAAQPDGTLRLDPISVEAASESAYGPVQGYKASRSATATKTDTPIIDIPASVQVVPREVIEDQSVTRLSDAVRNVSSVQNAGTIGNRSDTLSVRGFSVGRLAKDGFLSAASFGDAGFLDLANVERVEVLKGPASVLYGQNDPGGLINLVTKKPEAKPFYNGDLTIGSFDFYRGEVDVNQPVAEDGSLLFRFNGAYQRSDSFRDFFIDGDRVLIAPSLRWAPSPDTTLDLQIEYYDQEQQFDRGLVAIGDSADVLPRERYLGEDFSTAAARELRFHTVLDHKFNESWSSRSLFRVARSAADRFSADPRSLQADGRTLTRRVADLDQDFMNYAAQTNLTGAFDTGFLGHELLIGLDANFTRFKSGFRSATLSPIDVFDPVYGAEPGVFGDESPQKRRLDFYGVYLQDLVSLGKHWKLLAGGRFDYAKTRYENNNLVINDMTDREFSPRAGLVFQPIDDLSLYASYTESFAPVVFSISADGTPFKPEKGQQYEVGVKRDWLGGRLSTTLAAFQVTRQNVLTADPEDPNFSIQTGEQRSRGVELDVSGEIMTGWNVFGSLAYIDAEITKDNTFEEGNRVANVPVWSGSLWSTYTFQGGPLRGVELGGGVFAVGRRKGDLSNSFEAAGYGRLDAFARYRIIENVQLSLNVQNLLDKEYIEAATGRAEIYPGAPLSVFGKVGLRF